MTAPQITGDGWQGILDQDEAILWQGRPEGRARLDTARLPELLIGLVFIGFSLFWMRGVAQSGGFGWAFGLPFLGIGLWQVAQPTLLAALDRRRRFYTLTDRRAFVATDAPGQGRRLASYPITADTLIELDQTGGPDGRGSLWFTTGQPRDWSGWTEVRAPRAGFVDIPDAASVATMMRDIQARARKKDRP
ncbi:aspartate carbamoyltransferase catalytic subunit [Paracoccus sp. p4-l81]|uniref:aspartate carbamoyltransferase catalytic subunit n=1 Tax=unclassified Paracoccus (in: a-proteobacteria) TaxID=2688777 RepID=UPI0035BA94EE